MKKALCLLCAATMLLSASSACAANFYLIEDSDSRLLTKEELWQWEYDALSYVLNEIFARHGFHFEEGGSLEAYFTQQEWYTESTTYRTNEEIYELLNGIEWDNEHLVKEVRQEMRDRGTTNPNGRGLPSLKLMEMGGEMLTFTRVNLPGYGSIDVYSGPGTHYYRGAKGQAAVSVSGEIYAAGWDSGCLLIMYRTDPNSMRVGYIPTGAVRSEIDAPSLGFAYTHARITAACALTDDPSNTQRRIVHMPTDLDVTYLASYAADEEWAYIEAVIDGTPVRGFVPIGCIELEYDGGEQDDESENQGAQIFKYFLKKQM